MKIPVPAAITSENGDFPRCALKFKAFVQHFGKFPTHQQVKVDENDFKQFKHKKKHPTMEVLQKNPSWERGG